MALKIAGITKESPVIKRWSFYFYSMQQIKTSPKAEVEDDGIPRNLVVVDVVSLLVRKPKLQQPAAPIQVTGKNFKKFSKVGVERQSELNFLNLQFLLNPETTSRLMTLKVRLNIQLFQKTLLVGWEI